MAARLGWRGHQYRQRGTGTDLQNPCEMLPAPVWLQEKSADRPGFHGRSYFSGQPYENGRFCFAPVTLPSTDRRTVEERPLSPPPLAVATPRRSEARAIPAA